MSVLLDNEVKILRCEINLSQTMKNTSNLATIEISEPKEEIIFHSKKVSG
jgi:hypothetical protein